MPTPYGSRGGVAFSADELRVLGGALAIALQSDPAPEEAREYLRLAEAVDETVREGYRLRSFLLADLARYREALPGAASGYLDQLEAALTMGYLPRPDDLAALRTLSDEAAGAPETARRLALLRRCERLAEGAVRARLCIVPSGRTPLHDAKPTNEPASEPAPAEEEPATAEEPGERPEPEPEPGAQPDSAPPPPPPTSEPAASAPSATDVSPTDPSASPPAPADPESAPEAESTREPEPEPEPEPGQESAPEPALESTAEPEPGPYAPDSRPVPTPAEVFPPRTESASSPPGDGPSAAADVPAAAGRAAGSAEARDPVPV